MEEDKIVPAYVPTPEETDVYNMVVEDLVKGRTAINKSYPQFNNRSLYDFIDDCEKRWNGYLPVASVLTQDRSNIFLNLTRDKVISYISKLEFPKIKIIAVNKKSNKENIKFADALNDLIEYSNNAENAESEFNDSKVECSIKGTVVKYEGYLKSEQETEVPDDFDTDTGKMKTKKQKRIVYDNAYQELVSLEDFYIANPYQPKIQKQPWVIWKTLTDLSEADREFGHYPKFKYVQGGNYTILADPTTFYRSDMYTELKPWQVEIVRYYNKFKNKHVILINGVPVYNGVIPRKDGNYPFSKGIHEPFNVKFFWGNSLPNKIMGDQDLINTIWNMMVDKTYGSLMPFGLSSDLNDLVEDTILEPNKIRKVGDINNWRFETLPGVNSGEQSMLQTAVNFMKDNSGVEGGGSSQSPQGGKVTMRQAMLKQQELMSKLGFSIGYLEDFERDRTELRLHTILQFYSIPKIEKITDEKGKDIEKLMYREIVLPGSKLENGSEGTKVIKLIDNETANDSNKREKLSNDMFVDELQSSDEKMPTMDGTYQGVKNVNKFLKGLKKNVMAINVDSFYDYNHKVQVVKNSSHQKNQMLDRAERMEYAQFRLNAAQQAPVNAGELMKWVDESYDIDSSRFDAPAQPTQLDSEAMAKAGIPATQGAPGQALNASKPSSGDMLTQ